MNFIVMYDIEYIAVTISYRITAYRDYGSVYNTIAKNSVLLPRL